MNSTIAHQRLARRSLIAELWAELEAEEAKAKKSRRSPDWRTILRTKEMREEVAKSNT